MREYVIQGLLVPMENPRYFKYYCPRHGKRLSVADHKIEDCSRCQEEEFDGKIPEHIVVVEITKDDYDGIIRSIK